MEIVLVVDLKSLIDRKNKMKSKKIVDWFIAQREFAKFAWTIAVVVAALFGYQATLKQNPPGLSPTVAAKVAIENNAQEVISKDAVNLVKKTQKNIEDLTDKITQVEDKLKALTNLQKETKDLEDQIKDLKKWREIKVVKSDPPPKKVEEKHVFGN